MDDVLSGFNFDELNSSSNNSNALSGFNFDELTEETSDVLDGFNFEDTSTERSTSEHQEEIFVPEISDSDAMKQAIDFETEPWTEAERVFGRKKGEIGRGFGDIDYGQEAKDLAVGTLDTTATLAWGAASWIPAQIARHGAIAGAKIQNELKNVLPENMTEFLRKNQERLGIILPETPEEQAQMGNEVAEYIQTFGGTLGSETKSGQASIEAATKVIEPITKFAEWTAQGIDAEKYPNAHNLLATGVELGVFASLPKVAKSVPKLKKVLKIKKNRKGKKNTEFKSALQELEGFLETDKGIEVTNDLAKDPGLKRRTETADLAKIEAAKGVERQKDIQAFLDRDIRKDVTPDTKLTPEELKMNRAQDNLNQIEFAKKRKENPKDTNFPNESNIDAAKDQLKLAQEKAGVPIEKQIEAGKDLGKPIEVSPDPMWEQQRWNKDIDGDIDFSIKEVKKIQKEVSQKEKQIDQNIQDLGEMNIHPEEFKGTQQEYKIERDNYTKKMREIDELKVEIDNLKEQEFSHQKIVQKKKLFDFLKPLKNQHGAITLEFKSKQAKALETLKKEAKKEGKDLRDYLLSKGMEASKVDQILSMSIKYERPFSEMEKPKEVIQDFNDFNFFELKEGEMQSNISKDKQGRKANKNIKVGNTDARKVLDLDIPNTGEIYKWFRTPENFFSKFESLRPLLDQAREIGATIKNEKKILTIKQKQLAKKYPSKKLREEAGASWHNQTELGKEAMKIMKKKVKANPKYAELQAEMQPLFKDLLDQVNKTRVKLGKKPIPEMTDYLAFFSKESLFSDFKNLFVKGKEHIDVNLVMDDLATISQRHGQVVKDSAAFHHLKRMGLRSGVKLELDPLIIYDRYSNNALKHIHYSPLNAFVKELTTQKLTLPGEKNFTLQEHNPEVAKELISWSNKLADKSNLDLPPAMERLIHKATTNMTAAVLGGNLRTVAVQGTALVPTVAEYGVAGVTKAIGDYAVNAKSPIKHSAELKTRVMEAGLEDFSKAIAGSLMEKGSAKFKMAGLSGSMFVDKIAAEITWRAAWNTMKKDVINGKMTKKEAIRRADSAVVRLQASGSPVNLSPIQRNALGKMTTLWQTYTINHANWIATDLLGISNPKANPKQTAMRIARYVTAVAAVNTLAEDVIGIQSPYPAPIKSIMRGLEAGDSKYAIMLDAILELSEGAPLTGSLKFGSHPIGPLMQHYGDIAEAISGNNMMKKDLLPRAIEGDKKAMIAVAELLGKTFGVTGTTQTAKYIRGKERGESDARALIGRLGAPEKKSKTEYGKRRTSRAGRSRRARPLTR